MKTDLPSRSACTAPLARTVATPDRLREQGHLAEAVAAAEHVERHLLAVVALLDDARGACREHVERVGLVALADDHGAERERDELEALGDERPNLVGKQRERGELADRAPRASTISGTVMPDHPVAQLALDGAGGEDSSRAAPELRIVRARLGLAAELQQHVPVRRARSGRPAHPGSR